MASAEISKKTAATAALKYVEDGMTVGLGTGSTAECFIEALAKEVKKGLSVLGIPTSERTKKLAKSLGIPTAELNDKNILDLCVDGADEVDKKFNLIKGGGGALTREKIVASAALKYVVIVDESKLVKKIGTFPLPIEVIPFAQNYVLNELLEIGEGAEIRKGFKTDNGNVIIDVKGLDFSDPLALETELNNIPGVLENGIFSIRQPEIVIVGKGKEHDIMRND
ncbi:MAG: ribose-5-phosphate isomerase RpiA [Candidatus Altiarchaeota archaeon]